MSDAYGPAASLPSRRYAWSILAVLLVAMLISYCDRYLISVMVQDLRRDFHLSDTQIGLLQGLPFAVFFALAGVPMGWLADRYNRILILCLAVVLWSLSTMASTFATTYAVLLVLRMGVAVGEAALAPVAYPLIVDCFSRERAAIPTAMFSSCGYIGSGLAFMVGGAAVTALGQYPRVGIPGWGEVFGWQLTFLTIGAPGLLLGLLALAFKDPGRSGAGAAPKASVAAAFAHMRAHWHAFLTVYLAVSLVTVIIWGVAAWVPAMFQRTYGWTSAQVGGAFGPVYTGGLIAGTVVMAALCDRWDRRGSLTARMTIAGVGATAMVVFCVYPLMPTPVACLVMLALFLAVAGLSVGVAPLAVQQICPRPFRGQAIALYAVFLNLLGAGLGPLSVALVTDHLFKDPAMLRYSLALVPAVVLPLTALIIWTGRRAFRRAAQAALDWEA